MAEVQYLNAVVERGESLQLITEEYSRDAVTDLLKRDPEAIALAPAGLLDASRLLAKFKGLARLTTVPSRTSPTSRWLCYSWHPKTDRNLCFRGVLEDKRKVPQQLEELTQRLADASLMLVLVSPDFIDPTNVNRQLTAKEGHRLESVFAGAIVPSRSAARAAPESNDRERLRTAREELLARVPSFTSEDLAAGGDSISDNASQYALDLRTRGAVFGVRFGRAWHYPKFQFDAKRRPFDEMEQVLEALTPDPKGWDRLQWFLTPHEKLAGKTPLQVWKSDRKRVSEAANTQRWHGRRD